ncbi:ribokinase [Kaistia sp. 32K]|uniref:carbohydrate kinase family protein n=1 Tax=Kaistia sp. 32K TaxID=2795690 RepID=UPI001915A7D2|nr:carbohydrate kinase family protein [Kaistia sp. 32K]BCP52307.1 ribokinase [Kaistia sp. 32K]
MHYLFVGDISLDLSLQAPHMPAPDEKVHCTASTEGMGGVVTNTAVAFSRAGGDAALAIQLGDDHASVQVRHELEAMRLDLRPAIVPGGLCRVVTMIEPHGEKRLLLYPGVSIYPDDAAVQALRLDDVAHLHTACFGPAAPALVARARQAGIRWSIDLEPASFQGGIATLAPVLDGARVVFVNDRAADVIGRDPIARLRDLGVGDVVRTRGPLGAELYLETGEMLYAPPPKGLDIVDTTGAGDCLAGWFLAGLAAGWRIDIVLARAVRAASIACTRVGAQTAYPTLSELEIHEQD